MNTLGSVYMTTFNKIYCYNYINNNLRITIINFPSKFIPRNKFTGAGYEFEGDPNISDKLESLKPVFIWLLIQYYNKFKELIKTNTFEEPAEVKASTNEERKKKAEEIEMKARGED